MVSPLLCIREREPSLGQYCLSLFTASLTTCFFIPKKRNRLELVFSCKQAIFRVRRGYEKVRKSANVQPFQPPLNWVKPTRTPVAAVLPLWLALGRGSDHASRG